MKTPSLPSAPASAAPPAGQHFRYLLRHGRYSFTERELQNTCK